MGPIKAARKKQGRKAIGYAVEAWIPLNNSRPDGTQRSIEGCAVFCVGYYRNKDGSDGIIIGGGSVGIVIDPEEGSYGK